MLAGIPNLRGLSPWVLKDFRSPRREHPVFQNGWNRKGLMSETGQKQAGLRRAGRALPQPAPLTDRNRRLTAKVPMKLSPFSRRGFLQSTAAASLASHRCPLPRQPRPTCPDGRARGRHRAALAGRPGPRTLRGRDLRRALATRPGAVQSQGLDFKLGNHAMQSWPLAYWPDGSLKWTAHALAGGVPAGELKLENGKPAAGGLTVKQTACADRHHRR